MEPKDVQKRMREGWIKSLMLIEVLAITEEAARSSLENHVDGLGKEDKVLIVRKDFKGIREVENPNPNVSKGFSNVVELEILTENFDRLFYLVMNYGPSSVEVLEPERLVVGAGEAQGILNSLSDLIHRFASRSMGGIIIKA